MRDFFVKALILEAEENKDIIFITGDLGFGVFEEFERRFPKQYFNLGIAEQSMTGIAVGMALEGRPVVTYSIGNFPTLRCLEQIRNDAAYHNVNLTIVCIGGGFSYGQLGMSHHATEDLGIMRCLPNVEVLVPGSNSETELISKFAFSSKKTSYLRLDKSFANDIDAEDFEIGKIRTFIEGKDIAIIGIGGIIEEALEAAIILEEKYGITPGVFSCHSLKPFDEESFVSIMKKYKKIISIEEHNLYGGLGTTISESLVNNNIIYDSFIRLSINDQYSSIVGDQKFLRIHYGISANDIIMAVEKLMENKYVK